MALNFDLFENALYLSRGQLGQLMIRTKTTIRLRFDGRSIVVRRGIAVQSQSNRSL